MTGRLAYDTINISFCQGDSAILGGSIYTIAGLYSDTFAANPCDSVRTIRIAVFPRPSIQITASDTSVSQGGTVQLYGSGNSPLAYYWTSDAQISNRHIPNPSVTIVQPAWIIVQGTDANDCSAMDSIFINTRGCRARIYVPNAFTPNGDGKNDKYQIFGQCLKLISMDIFNRWGEMVWESTDINQTWDGTYRGAAQPPGVYVYWLVYVNDPPDGSVGTMLKGSITLIR